MHWLHCLGCLLIALLLSQGQALGCVGHFLIENGSILHCVQGQKKVLQGCPLHSSQTASGLWSWIVVDAQEIQGVQEKESGIYFFRGETYEPVAFLPVKEEATSCRLWFAPSAEHVLISWGMEYIQHLTLYDVGPKLQAKATFAVQGPPIWLTPHSFAYNAVDRKKGARVEGRFDLWWSSVVLYDCLKKTQNPLKKATHTQDYTLLDFDEQSKLLHIQESSVANERDWATEEKITEQTLSVSPALGN